MHKAILVFRFWISDCGLRNLGFGPRIGDDPRPFFLLPLTFLLLLGGLPVTLVASASPAPSAAGSPTSQPLSARVVAATETLNIDGKLAEQCWRGIPPLGGFVNLVNGSPARPKTQVQLAAARRWLYIAAICETEDIRRIKAFRDRRDSDVFNDDSFEALIDPLEPDGRVYRFVINSRGTRMDEIIPFGGHGVTKGRPFWLGRARHDVPPEQNRWTAEIAIDLASLELSSKNTGLWRANFIRHARGASRSDSAWAPARFWSFGCDKDRMGTIVGMERGGLAGGCRLRIASSDVRPAENLLIGRIAVEISNEMPERRVFDVTLRTMTRWVNTQQISAPGNAQKTMEFPLEMSLGEEHEIKIEATEPDTKMVVAAVGHVLVPTAPLKTWLDRSFYSKETTASLRAEIAPGKSGKQAFRLRLFNAETGGQLWEGAPQTFEASAGAPSRLATHIPLSRVPLGGYLAEAVLDDPTAGQRYRVWSAMRRLAPRKGEVKADAGGFLLRDGEPFFPIEVRRAYSTVEAYKQIKSKSAFNIYWAWYIVYQGTDSFMQNAYKGTGCLGDVNVNNLYYARSEEREDRIARIKRVAAVPCMFAYGMEHLPGEDDFSTEPMKTVQSYLQSLDPYHPFYMVLTHPSQVERYRDYADFLVMCCGAIGPGQSGEPEWVWEQIRCARQRAGPTIPVVAMLPAYRDYSQGLERPTPPQMRAITYMALVGGACGIVFDGYHYLTLTDPAKRGFSNDPALLDTISALSREVAFLGPSMISPSRGADILPVSVEQPPDGSVRWTVRRAAASPGSAGILPSYYIIAVNGSAQQAYAAFRLGSTDILPVIEVREVFQNRAVALDGSRFSVEFEPYGTRVFAITAKR